MSASPGARDLPKKTAWPNVVILPFRESNCLLLNFVTSRCSGRARKSASTFSPFIARVVIPSLRMETENGTITLCDHQFDVKLSPDRHTLNLKVHLPWGGVSSYTIGLPSEPVLVRSVIVFL